MKIVLIILTLINVASLYWFWCVQVVISESISIINQEIHEIDKIRREWKKELDKL